ncbi:RNA methyltransferase [Nitrosomonas eutropha]|uniref:tRNA (cytidine/uridine-2'-O-)-methyltransferase TrmJ n=2 Tax=Nitrosomonas eutropha TaxID=916 RepID=A0ABX5M6S0_9PROT|nr:RNA methyltransferase [Nitrosomonas eutropha]ABI58686.1 RNA methyltransferase, TrmH family, group 1 [Nitrosomonas eutropha C91]PXV80151.1 tRNA/rRNA methyltransferase [Nitrosomonas eutropha]SCX20885.1 tRNA/rRNA methyltransferase [Nitrosomonas eutropha]SEI41965.1 tRNA/rRNA methyltransferase [Nitrosomonas eutropha]
MNPASPLDNVRIVLSHTSHPGNIGATARAMKTMGLNKLYLINPKSFPDSEADARASNARDILETAHVCSNLEEALGDTFLAAALTARRRDLPHPTCNARQAAIELIRHAQHHPVALLFGRESAGLTAAEISHCQVTVQIPANPDCSSLNLAAAVQVMAYELRMVLEEDAAAHYFASRLPDAASLHEIEGLHYHLERVMIHSGFMDPDQPKHLMRRIRRLFARTRLEKEEVNLLRGLLTAVDPHNSSKS